MHDEVFQKHPDDQAYIIAQRDHSILGRRSKGKVWNASVLCASPDVPYAAVSEPKEAVTVTGAFPRILPISIPSNVFRHPHPDLKRTTLRPPLFPSASLCHHVHILLHSRCSH